MHLCYLITFLTSGSTIAGQTQTYKRVDLVNAGASILTWIGLTIINICENKQRQRLLNSETTHCVKLFLPFHQSRESTAGVIKMAHQKIVILFSLFFYFQTNICPNIAIFPITEVKCLAGVTAINLYNTWTKITIIMSWTIFTNTLCKKRIQMRADQLGISNVCICGG